MNLVFLSEHYEPRLGGVTSFINSLCSAIHDLGHEIWLIAPGGHDDGRVIDSQMPFGRLISIGTDIDLTGAIPSSSRISFCKRASDWIFNFQSGKNIDAVHILYGLYLMKYLNVGFLKKTTFRGCTIHNVPPQECANSWRGDALLRYWKDLLRLKLVAWVNERRILSQRWNAYVVPSHYVASELSKVVDKDDIRVVGHGIHEGRNSIHSKFTKKPFRILTVSGFTPHKCQHIIPKVLKDLRSEGLDVTWDVVGPNKNVNYVNSIISQCESFRLNNVLNFHFSLASEELDRLFKEADLYVHTSREEGFCLAVLEAATYGLPVIGRNTGAIPEIINAGKGTLFENDSELKLKIKEIVKHKGAYKYTNEDMETLKSKFSWNKAAREYIDVFQSYIS